MNLQEINNSLINTIKSPELEGLATDFSEIALDQLSNVNEVVEDVPIVGTLIKLIKVGVSVKDVLFLRKLGKFLWHLRDIPLKERKEMIEKLGRDSNYRVDVGYKIMLLLDRADDLEKPEIMANAFKAYSEESITYSQLQKINFAIDHLFIGDINEIRLFYKNPDYSMDESTHQNLELCGLVDLVMLLDGGSKPTINNLGNIFAEKVLLRK